MAKKNNVHALLADHLQDVEECLINFEGFMRAATTKETANATLATLCVGVKKAENDADQTLRMMIDGLGGSFLASTREELIALATSSDKIANKCETVAKMVVYRQVTFPSEFAPDFESILSTTRKQFDILEESIGMFFEKFSAFLQDHKILDEIRALESEVDVLEEKLKEETFRMDITLAEKLQLEELIEYVCDLSDIIEDIADKIQIMLISRKA